MSCPPSPRLSDLDVDQKLRLLRKLVAQLEEEWDEEDREMEKERIRRKKKAKRQREAREQEAARKQKQARKQKEARKAEETEEETDEDTEEETDEETGEEQERQAQQQAKKEANEWSSTWSMYLEEWKDLKELSLGSETLEKNIPWPVKSGRRKDVNESSVNLFFEKAPPATMTSKTRYKMMKTELFKWHPDRRMTTFSGIILKKADVTAMEVIAKVGTCLMESYSAAARDKTTATDQ